MHGNQASAFRSRVPTLASLALLSTLAVGACGGETLGTGGAADAGRDSGVTQDTGPSDAALRVPVYHRPDDSQCATLRPPGGCSARGTGPAFMCSSDGQCTDGGADGRCLNSGGGPAGCFCTYDACQMDTDCPTGQLCVCHDSPYSYGGNTCMPGNCRVDSDCGVGGYCSPAHGTTSNCGYVSGYYCHTRQDDCTNDSDCGGGLEVCTWSSADSRWTCQMGEFCA